MWLLGGGGPEQVNYKGDVAYGTCGYWGGGTEQITYKGDVVYSRWRMWVWGGEAQRR